MEKEQLLIEGAEGEIIEKIKKLEAKNDEIVKMIEKMNKVGVKVLRNDKWQIENKLVLKEEKVYVPKDESLMLEIIWLHYDMLIVEYAEDGGVPPMIPRRGARGRGCPIGGG